MQYCKAVINTSFFCFFFYYYRQLNREGFLVLSERILLWMENIRKQKEKLKLFFKGLFISDR